MAEIRIKDINISIWNHQKVQFSAHPDVNIIMGINGSGKTTFLSSLYKSLTVNMEGTENVVYLPSIDNIAMRDKRKTATALSQDLDYYIYDMKTGPSLMSLRMSMIDSSEDVQTELKSRIANFQNAVNRLFALTHKRIEIEGRDAELIVYPDYLQTRFFLNFSSHAFFTGFIHIYESARQVEGAFGGLVFSANHQKFFFLIEDEGYCGAAGIQIIGESAVLAFFTLEVVDLEIRRTANRAKLEFI